MTTYDYKYCPKCDAFMAQEYVSTKDEFKTYCCATCNSYTKFWKNSSEIYAYTEEML